MTTIISPLPNTFVNGTTIDAPQMNANFNQVVANVNANAAGSGVNNDITQLSGLTTPITPGQGGVPTGVMFDYAGSAAPSGYLLCNGAAVSRATYAALFGIIGTIWGSGDGSTTFNVPDFRGRVAAGYDSGNATGRLNNTPTGGADASAVGNTGGNQGNTLGITQMPSHGHTATVTDPGHFHVYQEALVPELFTGNSSGTNALVSNSNANTTQVTTGISVANSSTGGGAAHANVQPTLISLKIIKT